MIPGLHYLLIMIHHLNAVSQDSAIRLRLIVRKEKTRERALALDRTCVNGLCVVPKADRHLQCKPLLKKTLGEIPRNEQPLPLRRVVLSGVRGMHMRAREPLAIDPLLLHIEMPLVTTSQKKS